MKNLIIGFTGGVGRAAAKALLDKGETVYALVRDINKAKHYAEGLGNINFIEGDASIEADVFNAANGMNNLFYCVNVPYQQWYSKVRELLKISIDASVKYNLKFIFPGNVYVYGHSKYNPVDEKHPHQPHTRKGQIRVEMEEMIKSNKNLNYTIIRFPDFYGPYVINGFTEKLFQKAVEGKDLVWYGSLDVGYEMIFIDDAGLALVEAGLSKDTNNMEFNVHGYSEITARKILTTLAALTGNKSRIKQINSTAFVALGGLFDATAREFKEMMYLRQEKLVLDGNLYKKHFGRVPATPYPIGIEQTLDWVKTFYSNP